MTAPSSTRLGRDIRNHIPAGDRVEGYLTLDDRDAALWDEALPYLQVRNNDRHTLYAYGIARALLACHAEADPAVALPAILLHDVGWSTVSPSEVLEAIAPGAGRPDLVRQHEREGARIAAEILVAIGTGEAVVSAITSIIDGHDTRLEALSIEDAIVKDSDKVWRLTPDGLDVVQGWFGLTPDEALRLCSSRVHGSLFTAEARAMARALTAIASIDLTPQGASIEAQARTSRIPRTRR
jgi:hypothetical protein